MASPFESSGDDSSGDDEVELADSFEGQLQNALNAGTLNQIPIVNYRKRIDDVDDEKLLKEVFEELDDDDIEDIVSNRIHDLNSAIPEGETEQSSLTEVEEIETEVNEVESKTMTDVDVSDIAPNAMTPDEAREEDHQWRILIWGPPGIGKTHFSYTMPEPVCLIDTEGTASDISHKFDKEFFVWNTSDYDEAHEALTEALDVLHEYKSVTGQVGTIVVDSITDMWQHSQQKYVKEYYGPGKDVSDVEFSAGFGSGQSDWKKIKEFHNVRFRQPMLDSPFHLCWTAQSEEDYEAALEGERRDKPAGEKENVYKVDHIIHMREDDAGIRRAELEKSGLIKHRFAGLEDPTFSALEEVVSDIDEAENSDRDIDAGEVTEYDIELFRGNPRFIENE